MKTKAEVLFESSWEVCNKVGGIFTVLSSKSKQMQKHYDNRYFLIGPYFADISKTSFKEEPIPAQYKKICEELSYQGVICHFGKWLVEGDPNVILIDFSKYQQKINDIKKQFWDNFQVDSLNSAPDFNEPLVWSYTVGMLMEKIKTVHSQENIVLQAHEWLSGGAILYLKQNQIKLPTVFTTHATILGRTLAGNEIEIYNLLTRINPDQEARQYGIIAKHSLEKASAQNASVFTTVSQMTAKEAEHFLGRAVDIVLPNGLDMSEFPSFEEISQKHILYRNKLREFCLYYFAPYYDINFKESLFFFTASRYEFHNKGIDVFIKALQNLNEHMKSVNHKKTIITFFFVPTGVKEIKPEITDAREAFTDIKDLMLEHKNEIEENILHSIATEQPINQQTILGNNFTKKLERRVMKLRTKLNKNAPLSTHTLVNEQHDAILNAFREAGLENKKEDKVKVIFYPIYLSGADGLGDLDYYESIQAAHLGVFPSYYEPWGYTPLESAAWGVSAITSNLSGFGKYFYDTLKNIKMSGISIIDMENETTDEIISDLTNNLIRYVNYDRKDRIENKIQARKIAAMADWKNFSQYYIDAHNLSIEK